MRDDVLAATGGEQRPFFNASITGTPIFLMPRSISAKPQEQAVAPASPPALAYDNDMLDALAWQGALKADSRASFEEYRAQFPKGRFVKLAEANSLRFETATRSISTEGNGADRGTAPTARPAPVANPAAFASLTAAPMAPVRPAVAALTPVSPTQPIVEQIVPPAPKPDAADSQSVADLNRSIQENNDAIAARNEAARLAYEAKVAAVRAANG